MKDGAIFLTPDNVEQFLTMVSSPENRVEFFVTSEGVVRRHICGDRRERDLYRFEYWHIKTPDNRIISMSDAALRKLMADVMRLQK